MVTIVKGREPEEWTALNETPGVNAYAAIPELRDALLRDQGYICAYCMREIPVAKADPGLSETSKIEHISSRQDHPELQRSYNNMVVCCPGFINSSDHCDKSKGHQAIRFSPLDPLLQRTISYSTKDGEIRSANAAWSEDINNVVRLNNTRLKVNRQQVLDGVKSLLLKKQYSNAVLNEKLAEWKAKDNAGKRRPYCGIVIWYLEKKLRAHN